MREVWLKTCISGLESSISGAAILGVAGKVKYLGAGFPPRGVDVVGKVKFGSLYLFYLILFIYLYYYYYYYYYLGFILFCVFEPVF